MKKKLTNNLGMKLLSLVIAAMMWIVIINVDDPVKTMTINNVPVTVLNEDAIKGLNKVYEVVEGDTVNIKVKGKRSIVTQLESSDFVVTADLCKMNDFYSVPIEVDCPEHRNEIDWDITGRVTVMKIAMEDISTKQFQIRVVEEGKVGEGYYIGSAVAKPKMIEVSGAESTVTRIEEVRVYPDINNAFEDFKVKLKPQIYDSEGNEIEADRLTFSANNIGVFVNVLETKTVPIKIVTKGEPANKYRYIQKNYAPQKIEIAGKADVLANIDSIPVTINIQGKTNDINKDINLTKYLPKNVVIVGQNNIVTVKIQVKPMVSNKITFTTNDIKVNNLPEGLQFGFVNPSTVLSVDIMGLKSELENLSGDSLGAYIDLDNIGKGVHQMTVHFDLGEQYSLLTNPTVAIELTDKKEVNDLGGDTKVTSSPKPTDNKEGDNNSVNNNNEQDKITPKPSSTPKVTVTPIPEMEKIQTSAPEKTTGS